MKEKILAILSKSAEALSGQRLSEQLGVSRVAVWKQIQRLKEEGYPIEASSKGYRFLGELDDLFPWAGNIPHWHIHYSPVVSSTMEAARELALNGCPDRTVIVAKQQTNGRGRLERKWISEDGGLFFSIILRPKEAAIFSFRFNFAISLAIIDTLASYGIEANAKWPNDVLVNNKKICGILSEMQTQGEYPLHVSLGVGINVNNRISTEVETATSLFEIRGEPVSKTKFFQLFWGHLDLLIDQEVSDIVTKWKEKLVLLGSPVRVETGTRVICGTAIDVDDMGALLVETPSGKKERIFYGDCFSQPLSV